MEIGARVIEKQVPKHEDPLPKRKGGLAWEQLAFVVITVEGLSTIQSGHVFWDPSKPSDVYVGRRLDPNLEFSVAAGQAYAFVGAKCACVHASTGSWVHGSYKSLVTRR